MGVPLKLSEDEQKALAVSWAFGLNTKQIAEELGISPATVYNYRQKIPRERRDSTQISRRDVTWSSKKLFLKKQEYLEPARGAAINQIIIPLAREVVSETGIESLLDSGADIIERLMYTALTNDQSVKTAAQLYALKEMGDALTYATGLEEWKDLAVIMTQASIFKGKYHADAEDRERIFSTLNFMTDREAAIYLSANQIDPRTGKKNVRKLEEIGADWGIGRERVRQIANKAEKKMRYHLTRIMDRGDAPKYLPKSNPFGIKSFS